MIYIKKITQNILGWYQEKWNQGLNKYPWRIGKKNPYQILIAELLLQHTTAKAVSDNNSYQIFLKKYPDIFFLNRAKIQDLIRIFNPLGLYNQKSERIKKLTNYILEKFKGQIPKEKNNLLKVPGIGEYIANAILTFAYDQNEVPLDNNLKRIALNVWNIKKKEDLINFYEKLAEPNPKIIYWALFDVGRFHCRKPMPNCKGCPMNLYCENIKEKKISKT
ncbi:Adenine DNA glycosylase [subsurface metagenome]